jgi:peptidyl-dipeptidase A
MARAFYKDLGLEIEDILARSDLYERPGKCQHAFCTDIDRQGDVRILANIAPSERWMATTLHEVGHGVYEKYLDMSLPYTLREPAHMLTTEAVAILMERSIRSAWFLTRYAGVPEEKARAMERDLKAHIRAKLLVFCRWCSVMLRFEQALYRDPEQDLDALWWDLVERYQFLTRPEGRKAPDWAAKIHLSTAPVYYQNYLLGDLVASQLWDYIQKRVLSPGAFFASPETGRYLVEKVFRPGSREVWSLWLKGATDEALNPEHFAGQIA